MDGADIWCSSYEKREVLVMFSGHVYLEDFNEAEVLAILDAFCIYSWFL